MEKQPDVHVARAELYGALTGLVYGLTLIVAVVAIPVVIWLWRAAL